MINSLNRYIMKRMFSVFLLITVWLLVTPFLQAQSHVDKVLKDEITSDLKENILSFWERYSVDSSGGLDRKSTRLNSSHMPKSRMPSSA